MHLCRRVVFLGSPGSGKTTLCRSLLSYCQNVQDYNGNDSGSGGGKMMCMYSGSATSCSNAQSVTFSFWDCGPALLQQPGVFYALLSQLDPRFTTFVVVVNGVDMDYCRTLRYWSAVVHELHGTDMRIIFTHADKVHALIGKDCMPLTWAPDLASHGTLMGPNTAAPLLQAWVDFTVRVTQELGALAYSQLQAETEGRFSLAGMSCPQFLLLLNYFGRVHKQHSSTKLDALTSHTGLDQITVRNALAHLCGGCLHYHNAKCYLNESSDLVCAAELRRVSGEHRMSFKKAHHMYMLNNVFTIAHFGSLMRKFQNVMKAAHVDTFWGLGITYKVAAPKGAGGGEFLVGLEYMGGKTAVEGQAILWLDISGLNKGVSAYGLLGAKSYMDELLKRLS